MAGPVPVSVVSPHLLVAQAVAAGLRSVGTLAEARSWEAAVRERDPHDRDPRLPQRLVAVLEGSEDRDVVEQVDRIVRGGAVRVMVVTSEPASVLWGELLESAGLDVVSSATSVAALAALVERFATGRSSMDAEGRTALRDAWRLADGRRQRLTALLATLSPQQRRVLDLLASGRRVDEVGEVIGVARGTVRSHVKAMRAKLGARTQLEAVAMLNELNEESVGITIPRPRREWQRPGRDDDWWVDLIDPAMLDDDALAVWAAERAGTTLLVVRAGSETDGLEGKALEDAGHAASKTELDRVLAEARPDDAVLSGDEDDGARLTTRRVWIIDPLDGTPEFSESPRDDWAVHVALWEDGDLVTGAVERPARGELFSTGHPILLQPRTSERTRIAVSRSRPPSSVEALAAELDAELVPVGGVGAMVMSVVRDVADACVHVGGHHQWQSAAPVAVARAAGLHCSRADGTPLVYNQPDPVLPDLVVCRPELAAEIIEFVRRRVAH